MEKENSLPQPGSSEILEPTPLSHETLPPELAKEQADMLVATHDREQQPYFVDYLDPEISLEDRLVTAYAELEISPEQQKKLSVFLDLIELKHKETFYHSIRVALAAKGIAQHMQLDQKALLYAGLLHDVGKSLIPMETLGKTKNWTLEDSQRMEEHVRNSFELIRDTFGFSAAVVWLHHSFQKNPYPNDAQPLLHGWREDTKQKIQKYGRILAIADVYDALHRVNDKHGTGEVPSGDDIKKQMLEFNPDQVELIEELYAAGVLTTDTYSKKEAEG